MAAGESRHSALDQQWPRQAASPSAPAAVKCLLSWAAGALRAISNYSPLRAWRVLARDVLLAVARLDESALRFQCSDVLSRELLANLAECRAARRQTFDQPLVDRLAFAVAFLPVGRRHALVS